MDFGLLMESFEYGMASTSLILLYFAWYTAVIVLIMPTGWSLARGDTLITTLTQVVLPAVASAVFLFSAKELYRGAINTQAVLGLFFILTTANYILAYRALTGKGKGGLLTSSESQKLVAKTNSESWLRNIYMSVMFGLFAGSHYLDDGVIAIMILSVLFLMVNFFVGLRLPRAVVDSTIALPMVEFKSEAIASAVAGLVGILIGWSLSEEPTVAMTVFGVALIAASIGGRYIALFQPRSHMSA